jgi:hypothetical protein
MRVLKKASNKGIKKKMPGAIHFYKYTGPQSLSVEFASS